MNTEGGPITGKQIFFNLLNRYKAEEAWKRVEQLLDDKNTGIKLAKKEEEWLSENGKGGR